MSGEGILPAVPGCWEDPDRFRPDDALWSLMPRAERERLRLHAED